MAQNATHTIAQAVERGADPNVQAAAQAAVQSKELAGSLTGTLNGTEALSLWEMFWHADFIVILVALSLILVSFWCWAIIINKVRKIRLLNRQAEFFEEAFWSGNSLDQLYERVSARPQDPLTAVFVAAMREWRHSSAKGFISTELRTTLQQRIERCMQVTISREMEELERHMGFLASTGSTAPFVGLFGTVWGIMNSFQSIAASQNTSLAVVAPGIAEALLVTAIGLGVAIPAVIAYNKLSNDISRYSNRLDSFAHEFAAIISRQFEENS